MPLVSCDGGAVTGIYYDTLRLRSRNITALGSSCTGWRPVQNHLPLSLYGRSYLSPTLQGSPEGIFRSEASLRDVDAVEVCDRGGRCTGILLRYRDQSEATLGQWDDGSGPSSCAIYKLNKHGDLDNIRFKLSKAETTLVSEISIGGLTAGQSDPDCLYEELIAPANVSSRCGYR